MTRPGPDGALPGQVADVLARMRTQQQRAAAAGYEGLPMADAPRISVPAPEVVQPAQFTATQLPALRDQLLASWRSGALFSLLANHDQRGNYFPVDPRTRRQWTVERYTRWLIRQVEVAELFWVSPDMTQLITQAAAAAPFYQVLPDQQPVSETDDNPCRAGLVVYSGSVAEVDARNNPGLTGGQRCSITAALWAVTGAPDAAPGVHLVTLQDSDVLLSTRLYHDFPRDITERSRGMWGPLAYHEEYPLPWGNGEWVAANLPSVTGMDPATAELAAQGRVRNEAVAAVQTTWILMTQRLAVVGREGVSRQQRRAAQRAGRPEPVVRTVTLRRAAAPERQDRQPGASDRVYRHQWPVTGYSYWRNTWYARTQEHRQQLVYVPTYVKGPKDAPMIGGERVGVLRR